jgi:hypothetical protein
MNTRHCEKCGQVMFPSDHWQRKLAIAIEQRDEAVSRYAYVKKHFDEIYQLPIWTNDGNLYYQINSDKFDDAIDAAMKECNDPLELIPNSSKNYGDEMSNQIKEMQEFIAENQRLINAALKECGK